MMGFLFSSKPARDYYFMNKLLGLRKHGIKNSMCQWLALIEKRYLSCLAHIDDDLGVFCNLSGAQVDKKRE